MRDRKCMKVRISCFKDAYTHTKKPGPTYKRAYPRTHTHAHMCIYIILINKFKQHNTHTHVYIYAGMNTSRYSQWHTVALVQRP
jgi:hypothetical protein